MALRHLVTFEALNHWSALVRSTCGPDTLLARHAGGRALPFISRGLDGCVLNLSGSLEPSRGPPQFHGESQSGTFLSPVGFPFGSRRRTLPEWPGR
jgi:hypothetical protein